MRDFFTLVWICNPSMQIWFAAVAITCPLKYLGSSCSFCQVPIIHKPSMPSAPPDNFKRQVSVDSKYSSRNIHEHVDPVSRKHMEVQVCSTYVQLIQSWLMPTLGFQHFEARQISLLSGMACPWTKTTHWKDLMVKCVNFATAGAWGIVWAELELMAKSCREVLSSPCRDSFCPKGSKNSAHEMQRTLESLHSFRRTLSDCGEQC